MDGQELSIIISEPEMPHLDDIFNRFFDKHAAVVENAIYTSASIISKDYNGGLWETYTITYGESQIPLRLLDSDHQFRWVNHGLQTEGATDAKTFSAAASCYAYSHLSFAVANQGLLELAQKLSMAYHHTRAAVYENEDMFNVETFGIILD